MTRPERPHSIFIGFDPREAEAFFVARESLRRRLTIPIPVRGLVLNMLRKQRLYRRPTRTVHGSDGDYLWDEISDAPMATEFACSRFLVPHLAGSGFALFMDCDVLVLDNVVRLFDELEKLDGAALACVQHRFEPQAGHKMDGQIQTRYRRKNWSSVMAFDCDHPSNRKLTLDMVNGLPGRELHRFCWLDDKEIAPLDPAWNHLVGHSRVGSTPPKIVHFTSGGPWMRGYENVEFSESWRAERDRLVAG